jgi:hypothetical protein
MDKENEHDRELFDIGHTGLKVYGDSEPFGQVQELNTDNNLMFPIPPNQVTLQPWTNQGFNETLDVDLGNNY